MNALQRATMIVALSGAAITMPRTAMAEPVQAAASTVVRVGDHPGHGRVVFDLPASASFELVTEGDRVLLVFRGAGGVLEPLTRPRNVRSIQTGTDTATIELAPGARARPARLGDRLVIDILDPANAPVMKARNRPVVPPTEPPLVKPAPLSASSPVAATPPRNRVDLPSIPIPGQPASVTTPADAVMVPTSPSPKQDRPAAVLPAEPLPAVPSPAMPERIETALPQTFVIRADGDVGAAAFRRGDVGVIVLDRHLPEQATVAGTQWSPATVSTIIRVALGPATALRLTRTGAGWTVDPTQDQPSRSLSLEPTADGASTKLAHRGRVVTVIDPQSGSTLLVGTSLGGDNEGGVIDERQAPDYRVLASWLGLVVEPIADLVDVRATATGFAVSGGAALSVAAKVAQTQRFDIPRESEPALVNQLRLQLASAAAAPPRAKARDRLAAVKSMIALGLGAEAQALAQLTAAEDPQAALDAQTGGLTAMAAVIAGRPREASFLSEPRLDGSDEINLWRGLRDRRLGDDTAASRQLGQSASLVMNYPAPLQRRLWPDVAEAAAEAKMAIPLEQLPAYARAIALELSGQTDDALAAFDLIAGGTDRRDQVRASVRAAELRLAAGQITPDQAAAIMERQSVAWRGDGMEAAYLLRAAALRTAAQQWRPSLDMLKGVEQSFPELSAKVREQRLAVLQALLAAEGAGMSALDLVVLAAEYAGGVPEGQDGAAMTTLLIEKLTALDLPARVIPVLQGLMRTAAPGDVRAELGRKLATILQQAGDLAGATATLQASEAPGLTGSLRERRIILQAQLAASAGDLAAAETLLRGLGTAEADDQRALMLAKAGRWPGAMSALSDLSNRIVPAEGKISDAAQDVLLRQAHAAVQVHDLDQLRVLRRFTPRIEGARADIFRLLTAAPLDTAQDLARSKRELLAAQTLPLRLQTLGMR
ncbi:MAG: hypothetical protein ACRYGM_10830 [Janthinobacterium lividum]